jgi:hypothetical protein
MNQCSYFLTDSLLLCWLHVYINFVFWVVLIIHKYVIFREDSIKCHANIIPLLGLTFFYIKSNYFNTLTFYKYQIHVIYVINNYYSQPISCHLMLKWYFTGSNFGWVNHQIGPCLNRLTISISQISLCLY